MCKKKSQNLDFLSENSRYDLETEWKSSEHFCDLILSNSEKPKSFGPTDTNQALFENRKSRIKEIKKHK